MPTFRKMQYVKLNALVDFINKEFAEIQKVGVDKYLRALQIEMNLKDNEVNYLIRKSKIKETR